MVRDVKTLTNKNTSTWDKIKAGARLTLNVASAVATFTPVGVVAKLGRAAKVVQYLNKATSLRRQTEGAYQSLKGARDSLRTLTSKDKRISNKERMAALGKLALTAGGMTFGKFPGKHPLSGKLGFAAKNGSVGKAKVALKRNSGIGSKLKFNYEKIGRKALSGFSKEKIGEIGSRIYMKMKGIKPLKGFYKTVQGPDNLGRKGKVLYNVEAKADGGSLKRTNFGRQGSYKWSRRKGEMMQKNTPGNLNPATLRRPPSRPQIKARQKLGKILEMRALNESSNYRSITVHTNTRTGVMKVRDNLTGSRYKEVGNVYKAVGQAKVRSILRSSSGNSSKSSSRSSSRSSRSRRR